MDVIGQPGMTSEAFDTHEQTYKNVSALVSETSMVLEAHIATLTPTAAHGAQEKGPSASGIPSVRF